MHLFTVTEAFVITGRGVVLTPGLGENARFVRTGSRIKLVRPDKSELQTRIQGITFNDHHDILIGPEVTKADVPAGTEVWLTEE
jgi:hypothetical protein